MSFNSAANLTLTKIGNFVGLRIKEVYDIVVGKADKSYVDNSITTLKGGVPEDGNTLSKLYDRVSPSRVYPFMESLEPIIEHNTGLVPVSVSVVDPDGVVHHAGFQALDSNRVQIKFTEPVRGKALIVFGYAAI